MITCKNFKNFKNILLNTKLRKKRCTNLINSKNFKYFDKTLKIPSLKLKNETKHYDKLINIST